MTSFRNSSSTTSNPLVQRRAEVIGLNNVAALGKIAGGLLRPGSILLLGGSSLYDFRLRVAQSHVRRDFMPTYWSHAALLTAVDRSSISLAEISLAPPNGFGEVPRNNAIQSSSLGRYDDPLVWPNVALLSFPVSRQSGESPEDRVLAALEKVRLSRGSINLPSLLPPWLAFLWGAENAPNPLVHGTGIPAAVFVETVMAIAGLELTPGLSSQSSCPEAIWQSAKWWHDFYQQTAAGGEQSARKPSSRKSTRAADSSSSPCGVFFLRQPAAAIFDPTDKFISEKKTSASKRSR